MHEAIDKGYRGVLEVDGLPATVLDLTTVRSLPGWSRVLACSDLVSTATGRAGYCAYLAVCLDKTRL